MTLSSLSLPRRVRFVSAALLATSLFTASLLAAPRAVFANDGIFPAAPKAKPFIDFDGKGFVVNGKRTFLASGGMEYARVPRDLWRDRLLRIKRGGFNCVELYVFWDYHEPVEGKFNFAGNADLDAYLKLVKQMGMYAIVRVGPYICGEWDSGGYPVWLRFKPGMRVREDNPAFVGAVDRYFEKLIPIVAANQIHRGGAVILVQLENEHPQGWGTEMPNRYFTHLRDTAVRLGIEVPYFFSGLHHGSDPAGNTPWDSANRANPWFTTEFWPGWYDLFGPLSPQNFRKFDRGTWKILAYGGNGFNFYMLHGGSNFGYTNNDEDAASYDYAGAIGEAGDLRPIYYRFKRAALFARSFADILENSTNATAAYEKAATADGIRVTARTSPSGTLLFLDNNGTAPVQTQVKEADGSLFPAAGPVTVAPGEIMPFVRDAEILPGVILTRATRLLGVVRNAANSATVVAYGQAGELSEVRLTWKSPDGKVIGTSKLTGKAGGAPDLLSGNVGAQGFTANSATMGGATVRLVTLTDAQSDRMFFEERAAAADGGGDIFLYGSEYIGAWSEKNGSLVSEKPGIDSSAAAPPKLSPWAAFRADSAAQAGYKPGKSWSAPRDTPPQMGTDGDISPYAWYRATVNTPRAGNYTLRFAGGDWMSVFVNGVPVGKTEVKKGFSKPAARTVALTLPKGNSTLAIFAAHYGRSKVFNYLGPLDTVDIKGLTGAVSLLPADTAAAAAAAAVPVAAMTVTGWTWKPAPDGNAATTDTADTTGWLPAPTGPNTDVFNRKRGFAWFRATLTQYPTAAPGSLVLHFPGVDDTASVFLNGVPIGKHEGWDEPFDVPVGGAWKTAGKNVVTVLVENTDNTGGLTLPVTLTPSPPPGLPVTGWQMRGGATETKTTEMWQSLVPGAGDQPGAGAARGSGGSGGSGAPSFYRATFTLPADYKPDAPGPHPIWRLATPGMTRGFVTLNGHNLGRYPQRVPVEGLYLPEVWLKPGANELVIFDEEGASPSGAAIVTEAAASRMVSGVGG